MSNKVSSHKLEMAGIFAVALVGIAMATLGVIMFSNPHTFLSYGRESTLAIVVIVGTFVLLSTLTVVAVVFSSLNMGDKNQALGLPEGSVRAIIALSLIIIFVIMAVFMFQGIGPSFFKLENGTQYWNVTEFIDVTAPAYIPKEATQEQINIAQNIMTTVGTLVVALAGFYFGTRAVSVAQGGINRTLRITNPSDAEITWKKDDKDLKITVETTPEDEAVMWDPPEGDKNGKLVQETPKKFRYTRGKDPKPTGEVTLKFRLARYPDVTATLVIKPESNTNNQ